MALLARRQAGTKHRLLADINVVPYVDVMLVLVVILMVAAPFVNPSLVELPSVGKGRQQPAEPIEIIVFADGRLMLRDRSAGGKEARADLPAIIATITDRQKANPATPVVISADKNVRYEQVTTVMDRLYKANVQRVGLAVNPAQ
ncbi:MAG TPA: ExbD/TolR family protein [Burkholderiaceae bacterium]|nr:ExbD/TolR family protein [Burkholderiaceae bacterium]